VDGPYELHPDRHILTARNAPDAPLQRIGHGQLVQGEGDNWWHTFLCSRPLPGTRLSPLGRETGITEARWRDGWLYLKDPQPTAHDASFCEDAETYAFESDLPDAFQWLRSPDKDRLFSVSARKGALRIFGRESVGSFYAQGLVARRQTAWRYSAETQLDFAPRDYQTMAGLIAYYGRHQFHYLYISVDEAGQRHLNIQSCNGDWPEGRLRFPLDATVTLPDGVVELGVDVDLADLQFRWRSERGDWRAIGPKLDASILSDEGGRGDHASFTGAFVGMAAQDLNGSGHHADFLGFTYQNRKD
jgi:xylan 1,4-beta-xylosidase